MAPRLCGQIMCKNNGTCVIGKGESALEYCKCQSNYHGFFCEKEGSLGIDMICPCCVFGFFYLITFLRLVKIMIWYKQDLRTSQK